MQQTYATQNLTIPEKLDPQKVGLDQDIHVIEIQRRRIKQAVTTAWHLINGHQRWET